ncbi:MAG: peptide ABC transporter substrate-binding protein [Oscillatoriaceae cyanobacterium Prado104]|jgi:hypothetical protein|nr:peptide ABC transporter substrate-binding protein [Oscillatoriaceae cyanobacterium Prado104]
MLKNFLSDTSQTSTIPVSTDVVDSPLPSQEPVKLLVVGSRRGVLNIIYSLFHRGFAQVHEWSPLLPGPKPGEVMSILIRQISTK